MKQKPFRIKDIKDQFSSNDLDTIIENICGEKLGYGLYRDVFVLKQNPNYVVKIERDMTKVSFANASEWLNYINNREWDLVGPLLAPCEVITETGQILIQRRVYWNGKTDSDYPKHIPVVFTDIKRENYGWTNGGKFVCCDYSFMTMPMTSRKYKRAYWTGNMP